jgi:Amt family ammonium transporter
VNGNINTNLASLVGNGLWIEQLKAMGLTIVMALAGTLILAYLIKAIMGLRPDIDQEEQGLDIIDHGEAGYHMDEAGG